ncbi:putative short-chain type dehydrogenase/reductase y4lA [Ktedonobacter sp. SOSP1-52]|uniref:SDR family NAD(P)-dependent oxidoreductase n=1 Tax=Ktedonobacter sp. SOSP1-52 TaxID=2778366 RepID=UPI001915E33B|nr:SDR family oxidoreductase [Ktedonobacter sp. SOSP1-52]GHO71136.1 putative short-chain type dehydrogenase/reductase y4lA [Ktedonobacter sp. SOSP1-52]
MRGLNNKVAVVAGGGGGIGAATAIRLAEEGATVVVGDLDGGAAQAIATRIQENGGRAISVQFDMSDDASVGSLVKVAIDTYGGLDLMHANAADFSQIYLDTDVLTVPLEIFDRTLAVNLRGYVLCTRHALPELLKRRGAIVYTTSAAAYIGEPERVSYGVSKSGINALMRHVASRWGKEGIRANAVAPGLVLTEKTRDTIPDEFKAYAINLTRSTRLGEPADIAAMVTFLFSDDGAWINGQVISVDGGATLR